MERKTGLRRLAIPLQESRHGRWVDVKQAGGVCCRLLSRTHQIHDLLLLIRLELGPATTYTTLYAGHIQTTLGAFAQHGAFKLRKGADDLHHHAASGAPVIVSGELVDDSFTPEGASKPVFRVLLRANTLGLNIARVHEYSFTTYKEAEQQAQL